MWGESNYPHIIAPHKWRLFMITWGTYTWKSSKPIYTTSWKYWGNNQNILRRISILPVKTRLGVMKGQLQTPLALDSWVNRTLLAPCINSKGHRQQRTAEAVSSARSFCVTGDNISRAEGESSLRISRIRPSKIPCCIRNGQVTLVFGPSRRLVGLRTT